MEQPPLVELFASHSELARELVAFLSLKDQRPLLELCRAIVHSPLRREFFAKTRWSLPPARWMAERVLRAFTMKAVVTRVLLQREWQQYMLRDFPALTDVEVRTKPPFNWRNPGDADFEELAPQHFPLNQITKLDLCESKMVDVANLEGFTKLEMLVLPAQVRASNIHVLESLQSLKSFACYDTIDLSFVDKLFNLRELSVNQVKSNNFKPVAALKELETLVISGSIIGDLSPLMAVAPTLKVLDATEATIAPGQRADIAAFISSLVNVRRLTLIDSDFLNAGLEPFAPLVNLTALEVGGFEFEDLSPLASLTQLKTLAVMGQKETDWSPIAKLTKLKDLDQFAPSYTVVDSHSETARVLASLPNLTALSSPCVLSRQSPMPIYAR